MARNKRKSTDSVDPRTLVREFKASAAYGIISGAAKAAGCELTHVTPAKQDGVFRLTVYAPKNGVSVNLQVGANGAPDGNKVRQHLKTQIDRRTRSGHNLRK
jgi:hypothetical protein